MSEHPILFSGPMVRAILDGTKTQTRRMVKPPPPDGHEDPYLTSDGQWVTCDNSPPHAYRAYALTCAYGATGDRLWVREALQRYGGETHEHGGLLTAYLPTVQYAATITPTCGGPVTEPGTGRAVWKWQRPYLPSMFMPRWASRITLEVTAVRVERLRTISEGDAIAEGCGLSAGGTYYCGAPHKATGLPRQHPTSRRAFRDLWDSINLKRCPWDSDGWVWVVEFEVVP